MIKNINFNHFFVFFVRFLFTASVALFCAWFLFDIRFDIPTSDIHEYIRMFYEYSPHVGGGGAGFIDYLKAEFFFHKIYTVIGDALGGPESALRFFTFFSSFMIVAYVVSGGRWRSVSGMVVVSHPLVLDMVSSQQRIALAIAFFLILRVFFGGLRGSIVIFLLGSVHTYMAAMAVFQFYFYFVKRNTCYRKVLILIVGAILLAFSVSVLKDVFLYFIGDRRFGQEEPVIGFKYAVMWFVTYLSILLVYPRIMLGFWGFLFLISAFAGMFGALAGIYSSRYIALSIVFLAFFVKDIRLRVGVVLPASVYCVNLILSYGYWL